MLSLGVGLLILACAGLSGSLHPAATFSEQGESARQSAARSALAEVADARALLQSFFNAATVEERLQCVRHPLATTPRIRRHHARHPLVPRRIAEFDRAGYQGTVGRHEILWLNFRCDDDHWQTAVFERTATGLLLDWESLVGFEEMPWDAFVAEPPRLSQTQERETQGQEQTFRVLLQSDEYYNYQYVCADRLVCFRLENPARTATCWAYAERESTVAKTLLSLQRKRQSAGAPPIEGTIALATALAADAATRDREPTLKVTLRLRFEARSEGAPPNQAWIEEVVSESWFVP